LVSREFGCLAPGRHASEAVQPCVGPCRPSRPTDLDVVEDRFHHTPVPGSSAPGARAIVKFSGAGVGVKANPTRAPKVICACGPFWTAGYKVGGF
jgi:hypothetical protein